VKELEALAARKAALDLEVEALKQERARVRDMIDERRRLPVLPNIRIAAPCPASWDAMTGDRRVRACTHCKQNVFNLSAMSRADAEELVREKHGNLCAQYYQRADGTILLADCELGIATRRTQKRFATGAALLLAGSAAIAMWPKPPRPTAAAVRVPAVESFVPADIVVHEDAPPPDDTKILRGKIKISDDDLKELK
jgi:hypothetical protein